MPRRNVERVHILIKQIMYLCLKTYGIEHLMTWPINTTTALNLSLFFLKGFLNIERRNNAPGFYSRTGYDMFFSIFLLS